MVRSVEMQLPFALYAAANRITRMHKPLLEPLGLTFPQYLVVLELLDDAPLTVGELGTRLSMDAGTITPLLKRMQTAGMVTRTRDAADERRVLVDVTPACRAIEAEVRSVNGRIESGCQLSTEKLNDLRATLDALGHPVAS